MISKRPFQPQPYHDSVACWSLQGADLDHMSLAVEWGPFSLFTPLAVSFTLGELPEWHLCLYGWDHAAFSRTFLECSYLTSAFTLCPQQQLNEPSRTAEKCVWTPTQGLENCLAPGLLQAKKAQVVYVRAPHLADPQDARCSGNLQMTNSKLSRKTKPEESTKCETKILDVYRVRVLLPYIDTWILVKLIDFNSSFLILNCIFEGLGYKGYRQCSPSTTGLFSPQPYVKSQTELFKKTSPSW